ncbi:uncharacterized protein N7484_004973 [Penicillium longicatenatum]|uniref:uncharacterized protein n=1 Tax=Penicillium longicatenatum TaxID=1561947 RepID=UPI0025487695|nr:uncharacterized protein N7484_004973 [Penicillium longicatenatum]KAJ5651250.1 hypothetical protein N7484_004973 [Penicillium longicatenatum]
MEYIYHQPTHHPRQRRGAQGAEREKTEKKAKPSLGCFGCGNPNHHIAKCPERAPDTANEDFQIMMLEELTRDKKVSYLYLFKGSRAKIDCSAFGLRDKTSLPNPAGTPGPLAKPPYLAKGLRARNGFGNQKIPSKRLKHGPGLRPNKKR